LRIGHEGGAREEYGQRFFHLEQSRVVS